MRLLFIAMFVVGALVLVITAASAVAGNTADTNMMVLGGLLCLAGGAGLLDRRRR